jgi:uncharacterized membrane protein
MNWIVFALMTVVSWGLYGIFLHSGTAAMKDQFKAFLFVGLAYFLTAVLAPLAVLTTRKTGWSFPAAGMGWSLLAGVVGAVGAFCVLLAFRANGSPGPGVVMSIVFGGAPIINAIVAMIEYPPAGGWSAIRWQFYLGIVLAAAGGCLVTFYKPPAGMAHATAPQVAATKAAGQ